VLVTFGGADCEIVIWPDGLHPNESPLVAVTQDECAFNANDDCPWEWCENGRMSLKQKSKGGLLMVSEFLSELAGRLRCTKAEAEAYAVSNPDSRIAQLVEEDKAEQGVEARLILEPGGAAGKDNYFDNAQLLTQTKLAMEVFDAMERHRAPPRDVRLPWSADGLNAAPDAVAVSFNFTPTVGPIAPGKERPLVRLELGMRREGVVRHLPSVRCQALIFFDHSSGHEAGATDGRSATSMTKGPDWNGKQPWMRDGFFADLRGPSWPCHVQKMQYEQGDVLPCDVPVPSGIDPNAGAAPAATQLPQVLPEQLLGRSVVKNFGGFPINGTVMLVVDDDLLACKFEVDGVSDWELTVEEVLSYLVGPAPEPEQHQEAPPSDVETEAAIKEFLNGIRPRLKKNNDGAPPAAIRKLADAEWVTLGLERRLHFVRKVRSKAAAAAGGVAASRVLKCGEPVPARLWGRQKGMQALLAERGLPHAPHALHVPPLRGACENQEAHGGPKLARVRRPSELWPEEIGGHVPPPPPPCALAGLLTQQRNYLKNLENSCCCRRLLASQPDFQAEHSGLERVVATGGHHCIFLPKFHCNHLRSNRSNTRHHMHVPWLRAAQLVRVLQFLYHRRAQLDRALLGNPNFNPNLNPRPT